MGDTHGVRYKATMTREQWRATHMRAETANPKYKSQQRWLSALSAETFEVAEVTLSVTEVRISGKPWQDGRGQERVTLDLSRDAVLAVKMLAILWIRGDTDLKLPPATLLDRKGILDSIKDVGPAGTLLRLVEKEAVLPDSPDLEEDKLELEPEAEKAALPAPKPAEAKG